jgi:hypothetical protein
VTLRTLGNGRAGAASFLGMHAYQYLANLIMLDAYPTEIGGDRAPRSTRGPAMHRKVRVLRGHRYTMLL